MLLELFDWGFEARTLQIFFALAIGLVLGVAAQITRFCLRRAVAGDDGDRSPAAAVWLTAFATAVVAFYVAQLGGYVDIAEHRFFASELPALAIIAGGLMFGVGMVLTRGCVSRLTVLSATGNLRALTVITLFAVTAHATMKGVLAPLRTGLSGVTIDLPIGSFAEIPLLAAAGAGLAVIAALWAVLRAQIGVRDVILGAVIGLVPVLGWATTSTLLFDEFDPLPLQSAAFTLPWTDTLFWVIAGSAIPAGFGTGLIGGVFAGSFLSAAARGELRLVSFESPGQTLTYGAGAALMGVGGVLAGGCTVGAGLSGASTLSVAAILALISIVVGAVVARGWASRPLAAATV